MAHGCEFLGDRWSDEYDFCFFFVFLILEVILALERESCTGAHASGDAVMCQCPLP